MKKVIAIALVLAVVAVAGYALTSRDPAPSATYTSMDARKMTTDSLKGKVVLVNFWATSCPGCVKEMTEFRQIYQQLAPQGKYETLAVAMNYDPPNYVKTFVAENKLPFPIVLDSDGKLAEAWGGIQLVPSTFLVGKDGQVIKRYLGEPDFRELRQLIDQAIAA